MRLFDRNAQGVELTAYGRALLKCGVTVFDEMRQGLKQIELLVDPAAGELRIGSPEITMAGFLPPIVERVLGTVSSRANAHLAGKQRHAAIPGVA